LRGRFITFEGGEGAGKSTQVQRLRARLEARGRRVVTTREPGGTARAEEIRDFLLSGAAEPLGPFAEALLFASARADHVDAVIRPALERGDFVLCDRFADSTRIYQGRLGRVDAVALKGLEKLAVASAKPDLTLVLDVPAPLGMMRAEQRRAACGEAGDRFETQGIEYHEAIRQGFLAIAREEPRRCAVIDATADADAVERLVWSEVEARLLKPRLRKKRGAPEHAHGR
jgi:dTMP kinase